MIIECIENTIENLTEKFSYEDSLELLQIGKKYIVFALSEFEGYI